MARQSTLRLWTWVIASVFVTSTLLIPASFLLQDHARRWYMLSMLTSPAAGERKMALKYVIARAGEDPRVVRGAMAKLDVPDQVNFLQIAGALDQVGRWSHPPAPASAWLRWISILARDPAPQSRIVAAQRLTDLSAMALDPRVRALLGELLADPVPDVRYNALASAATLSSTSPAATAVMARMVRPLVDDKKPLLARHAVIVLTLMGWPTDAPPPEWRGRDPLLASALVWAHVKLNPDNPSPAIEALADRELDDSIRRMAAYALALSPTEAATDALVAAARYQLDHATPDPVLLQRVLLALPIDEPTTPAGQAVFASFFSYAEPGGEHPLASAAAFRLAQLQQIPNTLPPGNPEPGADPAAVAPEPAPVSGLWGYFAQQAPVLALAMLEGLEPGARQVELPDGAPLMARLAAAAVSAEPQPDSIYDLFSHDESAVRDLACVVAARRFSRKQNLALARRLLLDFNDRAKMSGAILCGLTGVRPQGQERPLTPGGAAGESVGGKVDILEYRVKYEDIWEVQQVLLLGLWMQGQAAPEGLLPAGGEGYPAALLARDDLPRSTIVLAMLHRRHPGAVGFLFNPQGELRFDLVELFGHYRWWRVLGPYLRDPPPFWVWADPQLQRFQVDVMRNWALLQPPGRLLEAADPAVAELPRP